MCFSGNAAVTLCGFCVKLRELWKRHLHAVHCVKRQTLRIHIQQTSSFKWHPCHVCHRRFSKITNRDSHVVRAHGLRASRDQQLVAASANEFKRSRAARRARDPLRREISGVRRATRLRSHTGVGGATRRCGNDRRSKGGHVSSTSKRSSSKKGRARVTTPSGYDVSEGFKCSECSFVSTTAAGVKRHHSSRHSGKQRHECPRCSKPCRTQRALVKHHEKHHPVDDAKGTLQKRGSAHQRSTEKIRCIEEDYSRSDANDTVLEQDDVTMTEDASNQQ